MGHGANSERGNRAHGVIWLMGKYGLWGIMVLGETRFTSYRASLGDMVHGKIWFNGAVRFTG